jgi:hypothetical protein
MRTEVLHIRLTPQDMKRVEQRAARHRLTVSEYVRACLQQDWVMSGDKETMAEVVHETAERLAGRLLAAIGPGKARPTGRRAFPFLPEGDRAP